jgi:predicted RNA-binding Zn ribbon-like protein
VTENAHSPAPAPRSFPLLGEPLAIDLVNTVAAVGPNGALVDLIATTDGLRAWIDTQAERLGDDPAATAALLDEPSRIHDLREALRRLFRAVRRDEPPDAEALALVNAASADAPSYPVLDWPADGPPRALLGHEPHHPAALPLATIARSGINLLSGEQRHLVRACEGSTCVLLFLATNPRRHWCSPATCGNRARVARHYQRRHQSDTPSV